MRLAEAELKQIVQEEIEQAIEEGYLDRLVAKAKGFGTKTKAHAQSLGQRAGTWAREKSGADPETVAGERAAAAATKKAGAESARRTRALHIIKKSWDRFHDDLKAVGAYEVPEIVVARDAMMNAIEKLTPDQAAPATAGPEKASAKIEKGDSFAYTSRSGKESAVQVVNPKNTSGATVAQKIDPASCAPVKGTQFASNPEKFAAAIGEPIEKCSAAPDPADAETIQVAPVTDIGSASARKKGGGDTSYSKWAKRAGIREE